MTTHATQTWIITGASKGLGRALAEAALAAGDNVVAAVRNPDSVADLAAEYSDTCLLAHFDARDTHAAAGLASTALDRFGRLDVLVNNAGRAVIGAIEEVGDAQLRDLMDLHLFGPAALVRAALPVLRGQGSGTIVQPTARHLNTGQRPEPATAALIGRHDMKSPVGQHRSMFPAQRRIGRICSHPQRAEGRLSAGRIR